MTLRLNGSTSGYVEIDAPAAAGSNTLVLPTGNGTSGQVLSTNGSGALSWVQGGRILQVVQAVSTVQVDSSTSTYADTGLTASITPSSAVNKILVLACQNGIYKDTNSTALLLKLVRGSTDLLLIEDGATFTGTSATIAVGGVSATYLDSPSTISSVTYKLQFASSLNVTKVRINVNSSASTLTLMEVAA
jgi:hypothetical protein